MRSILLIILSTCLLSCGTDNPLSRGNDKGGGGDEGGFSGGLNKPSLKDFNHVVLPNLSTDCAMCHGNPAQNYGEALSMIEVGVPSRSPLYQVSIGMNHLKVWAPDRPEAEALAKWIRLEALD